MDNWVRKSALLLGRHHFRLACSPQWRSTQDLGSFFALSSPEKLTKCVNYIFKFSGHHTSSHGGIKAGFFGGRFFGVRLSHLTPKHWVFLQSLEFFFCQILEFFAKSLSFFQIPEFFHAYSFKVKANPSKFSFLLKIEAPIWYAVSRLLVECIIWQKWASFLFSSFFKVTLIDSEVLSIFSVNPSWLHTIEFFDSIWPWVFLRLSLSFLKTPKKSLF